MKKAILPILLLFFGVTCLLALESEPSSTVGFLKYQVGQGYSYFCLPFTFYKNVGGTLTETMTIEDIVGTQMTGGSTSLNSDRIMNLRTGGYGYLKTDGHWYTMTSFEDNVPYRFHHRAATSLNVFLAGTVVRESQTVGTFAVGGSYAAVREAASVNVSQLDLNPGTGGFAGAGTSLAADLISDPITGNIAWYKTTTSAWQGLFQNTTPGIPIYVLIRSGHPGFTWTYDPNSRGTSYTNTQNASNK